MSILINVVKEFGVGGSVLLNQAAVVVINKIVFREDKLPVWNIITLLAF